MRRIIAGKSILNRIPCSNGSYPHRPFCSTTNNSKATTTDGGGSSSSSNNESTSSPSLSNYSDQYKALENLDFTTAAKILFSEPPKKKKFGLDFHLELERKKQAEFEAQAKEMELKAAEQKAAVASNPALLEVKERLDKLEQTVKEIAVESGKKLNEATKTGGDGRHSNKQAAKVEPENTLNESIGKTSKEGTVSNEGKQSGLAPVTNVSQKRQNDDKR